MMAQMQALTAQNSELNKEMFTFFQNNTQDNGSDEQKIAMPSQTKSKPSNRPRPTRPTIEADLDGAMWAVFLDKWRHYKRIAELTEQEVVLELHEACSPQVHKLLYQYVGTGALHNETITEEELLTHIKSVAVKAINVEVYRWRFTQLRQEQGEPVTKYVGRLKSEAVLCNYFVKCQCDREITFAEEMISQQLITGLANQEHQSRLLSEAQELTTLQSRIDRLISLETTDDATAHINHQIASRSSVVRSGYKQEQRNRFMQKASHSDRSPRRREEREYQRGRGTTRGRVTGRRDRAQSPKRRCNGCGRSSHPEGKGLSREECPVFGQTCHTCGQDNHFAKVCSRR